MHTEYLYNLPHDLETLDTLLRDTFEQYLGANSDTASVTIFFSSPLPLEEEQELSNIVHTHSSSFSSSFEYLMNSSAKSQEQNMTFGRTLLHDFMRKNILEGMNISQSLWVFSRFEAFEVSTSFGSKRVDLFKMFQSGAIPTVYFCILQVSPDSMEEGYHWITADRLEWVKVRLREFLGQGMSSYIESLVV
jgi:hypothetical protein